MTCRTFVDSIYDYLESELRAARRREMDEHRGACGNCASYLASYVETVRLVSEAFAGGSGARGSHGETFPAATASNGRH